MHIYFVWNGINTSAAYDCFPTLSNHRPTFKMHSVDFQSAVSCKSPLRGGFYEAFIAPYSLVQVKHC